MGENTNSLHITASVCKNKNFPACTCHGMLGFVVLQQLEKMLVLLLVGFKVSVATIVGAG